MDRFSAFLGALAASWALLILGLSVSVLVAPAWQDGSQGAMLGATFQVTWTLIPTVGLIAGALSWTRNRPSQEPQRRNTMAFVVLGAELAFSLFVLSLSFFLPRGG